MPEQIKKDKRSSPELEQILLNRKQTSQFLGVTDKVVGDLNLKIVKKKGQLVYYDLKEAVKIYVEHREKIYGRRNTSKNIEETRLIKTKADKAELELALYKNNLHEATTIKSIWHDQILRFRSRLLALPAKMSLNLSNLTAPNKIESALNKEVKEVLDELQKYKSSDYSELDEQLSLYEENESNKPESKPKQTTKKQTKKKKTISKKVVKKKPTKKKK